MRPSSTFWNWAYNLHGWRNWTLTSKSAKVSGYFVSKRAFRTLQGSSSTAAFLMVLYQISQSTDSLLKYSAHLPFVKYFKSPSIIILKWKVSGCVSCMHNVYVKTGQFASTTLPNPATNLNPFFFFFCYFHVNAVLYHNFNFDVFILVPCPCQSFYFVVRV